MADKEAGPDGKPAGTDDDKVQTVTAEQFAELQKRLEAITAMQSGSDKKVAELTKALTEERKAKESSAKTAEERIVELEKARSESEAKARRAELRTYARGLLDEAGIKPPKIFDRLIGNDETETESWVKAFIADEQERTAERNKAFDRDHGRTVSGPTKDTPTSYERLTEMTDEELKRLSPKAIAEIVKKAAGG